MDEEENTVHESDVKFCPICGDTMHKEQYLGSDWWFCDDPDCGFFEPS